MRSWDQRYVKRVSYPLFIHLVFNEPQLARVKSTFFFIVFLIFLFHCSSSFSFNRSKLYEEAKFEQSKRLLKQVSFMMMMPHELLVQIAAELQMETYLKSDVVVSGGQKEEAM